MSELIARLPNARLLVRVRELIRSGNTVEAELLEHLGEVDARRLYLGLAPRWRTLHLRLAERATLQFQGFRRVRPCRRLDPVEEPPARKNPVALPCAQSAARSTRFR